VFLSDSSEYLCPICKEGKLIFRDYCKRIVKHEGGEAETILIPRHRCGNPRCKKLHRMLPDFLVPFKHYTEDVISDAVSDRLDINKTNDEPSVPAILRWKRWISLNTDDINGHLRSIGHRELGFSEELLRSSVSLLNKLMDSVPRGWLRTILRLIYNSGAFLVPVYSI